MADRPRTWKNARIYPSMRGWPPLGASLTVTLVDGSERHGLMAGYFDSPWGGRFVVVDNFHRHVFRYDQVAAIALADA